MLANEISLGAVALALVHHQVLDHRQGAPGTVRARCVRRMEVAQEELAHSHPAHPAVRRGR